MKHRTDAANRLDISEEECRELLGATTVGRIAFHRSGGIAILPVNYVLDHDDVIIRTSPDGTLADIAATDDEVAFEIDYHNGTSGSGWSVVMSGTATVLTPQQAEDLQLDHRVVPWADGDRSLHLRFVPKTITGRRVQRRR